MTNHKKASTKKTNSPSGTAISPSPETTQNGTGTPIETRPPTPASELAILDPQSANPVVLEQRIKLHEATRKVMTDFISRNMKEGQDYGKITFVKRDGSTAESKNTLFKPGSEKFCSLFGIQPRFRVDLETREMLGNKPGLVAYVCELMTKDDKIVGEGRGVADLSEKQNWSANNAVKIAEKRAQIDAVLRSGGLSDFFTQDLEDEAERDPKTGKQTVYENQKISQAQVRLLFVLLKKAKRSKEDLEKYLLEKYNVIGLENMPRRVASELIDQMTGKGQPKKEIVIHVNEQGEETDTRPSGE